MKVFYSYLVCPECQHRNTPWRTFCKRCRGPIHTNQHQAHTDETLTIYRAEHPLTLLVISPQYLAYQTHGLAMQSSWENIRSLVSERTEPHLTLREPAIVSLDHALVAPILHTGTRIPLAPFGFPENHALQQDLERFVPQRLRKRLRLPI